MPNDFCYVIVVGLMSDKLIDKSCSGAFYIYNDQPTNKSGILPLQCRSPNVKSL